MNLLAPSRRVVVTGIGVVSPIGLDESAFWDHLMAGKTGIRPLRSFDSSPYRTRIGAEVDDTAMTAALDSRQIRPLDRTADMAVLASSQALEQSGLIQGLPPYAPRDIATVFATGAGSTRSFYQANLDFAARGPRGVRPTAVPRCMANVASAQISIRFRLTGPNYMIVAACTSSATAIGTAFRMIRDGYAAAVLCGGSDTMFDPATFSGWDNLGVLSKNPDPAKACRPFDATRDGTILGEGAGALVLESLESAAARRARVRAEIVGYGESSDAEHLTHPSVEGQSKAILAALRSAEATPGDISFINAHGTATRANDECECQSIRAAFGDAADRVRVASCKSFFGHLLGSCSVIETIVSILGLERGQMPGNLNLDNPDPKCNLPFLGPQPTGVSGPLVMKNSFGFGGNNAVLIIRKWEQP